MPTQAIFRGYRIRKHLIVDLQKEFLSLSDKLWHAAFPHDPIKENNDADTNKEAHLPWKKMHFPSSSHLACPRFLPSPDSEHTSL